MNTNIIIENEIKDLQVLKIFKTETTEVLLITLEKGKVFPKHASPKHTFLVVIEGNINFHINNNTIELEAHEVYSFKRELEHFVIANENSKFLIIR